MALSAPTNLTTATDTNNTATIVTGSISPSSDVLLVVSVSQVGGSSINLSSLSTTLSNVGSWTIVNNTFQYQSGPNRYVTGAVAYAVVTGSPGSGTITATFSGSTRVKAMRVAQVTGYDTSTPVAQNNSNQGTGTTLTVTLGSTPTSTSMVFGVVGDVGSGGMTPGTGFTELGETTATGSSTLTVQSQYDLVSADTTCDWASLVGTGNAAVAIEINEASGAKSVNVNDTITITESTSQVVKPLYVNVNDTLTITESTPASLRSHIDVNDTVTITESSPASIASYINTGDDVTITESVAVNLESYIDSFDAVTITESVTVLVNQLVPSVSDTITITEDTTVSVSSNNPEINVYDNIYIRESGKTTEDQTQTSTDGNFTFGDNAAQILAQGITPSVTAPIGNIELKIRNNFEAADNLRVDIYSDSSGSPNASLGQADNQVSALDMPWQANYFILNFVFSGGPTLTSGTQYWIVISRTGSLDDSNSYAANYKGSTDPYSGGQIKYHNGSGWVDGGTTNDLYFKESYLVGHVSLNDNINTNDTITITESTDITDHTLLVNVNDTIAITESVTATSGTLSIDVNDSIAVTDSPNVGYNPRYWVGGTGSWSDATNHWALVSGGTPGASNGPDETTDVYFDSNSGSGTLTLASTMSARSFDTTGSTLTTFAGSGSISIYGDLTVLSGATWSATTQITFNGTSANITTNGVTINATNIYVGIGATLTVQDSLTGGSSTALLLSSLSSTGGTLNTNDQTISVGGRFGVTGAFSAVHVVNLGSSDITCGDITFSASYTGTTLNAGTSSITVQDPTATTSIGSRTLNNLTVSASGADSTFTLNGTLTIGGSLAVSGTSSHYLTIKSSSAGTQRTISKSSGTVNGDYLDLQDSNAAGGATFNATNSIDRSNNDGWIFGAGSIFLVNVSDSIAVTESQTVAVFPLFVNVNDTITTTESATVAYGGADYEIDVFDIITLEDVVGYYSDQIDIAEWVDVDINAPGAATPAPYEDITITESVSVSIKSYIDVNDTVTITDSPSLQFGKVFVSVSDTITITDSPSLTKNIALSVFDNITVTENTSFVGPHYPVTPDDVIRITEYVAVTVTPDWFPGGTPSGEWAAESGITTAWSAGGSLNTNWDQGSGPSTTWTSGSDVDTEWSG